MYRNGSPEARMGHQGEQLVRAWLVEQGYHVIRTADIVGGAPMLEGAEPVILPDILAALDGVSRWVEVKTKTVASRGPTRTYDHGIPLRQWEHYRLLEHKTGIPGSLCVIEREPEPLILLAEMANLPGRRFLCGRRPPYWESMIFFDRMAFDWYAGPAAIRAFEQIHAHARRTLTQPPPPRSRQLALDV